MKSQSGTPKSRTQSPKQKFYQSPSIGLAPSKAELKQPKSGSTKKLQPVKKSPRKTKILNTSATKVSCPRTPNGKKSKKSKTQVTPATKQILQSMSLEERKKAAEIFEPIFGLAAFEIFECLPERIE